LEQISPARLDAGKYVKPRWALKFWKDGIFRSIPVHCGGDKRPLGKDLENACEGLGLTNDQIYNIPVVE